MKTPLAVGVIGLSDRGLALAAILDGLGSTTLSTVCDQSPARLNAARRFPTARCTDSAHEVLRDESLDAVVLATSGPDCEGLVGHALAAGKHVLVPGPPARSSDTAAELALHARQAGRCLLAAAPVLFEPALRRLKEALDAGAIGEALFARAEYHAPGSDTDPRWGSGATAISALLHLLGDVPVEVTASAEAYRDPAVDDVVAARLHFATGVTAQLSLSRLDPRPARRITIVGSRGAAVLDAGAERPLMLFEGVGATGDVVLPAVAGADALRTQVETFVSAVRRARPLVAEGRIATSVVTVLEALDISCARGGAPAVVAPPVPQHGNVFALSRA